MSVLLFCLLLLGQMLVEARVGDGNQALVKPPLIRAGLVATDQQDGLAFGVERESHAPDGLEN